MYHQYFGLREAPFSIAVNPRYLYMSPRHRDALAHLLYGVGAGGGFILLTGEVGTGKTTLNRCLIEQLPDQADVAVVLNPALDARDLLACVCEELGITTESPVAPGLKELTDALHRFLLDNHRRGRKTVLMIDEAQHLDFPVLEQIRLLTNLETHEEKLLHIILIGQPELASKLARPELRQLNQRITARYDLQPLNREETAAYIQHRLQVAGMAAGRQLFAPGLMRAIHRRSRGVPRLINLLCDRMLLGAYGRGSERPDAPLLRAAAREVLGELPRRSFGSSRLIPVLVLLPLLAGALWWVLQPADRGAVLPGNALQEMPTEAAAPAVAPALAAAPIEPVAPGVSTAPGAWQLPPAEGTALLASLYGASTLGAEPCTLAADTGLRCESLRADTWDELLATDRPLLLNLVDAQRFAARALFLGIDGDRALLAGPDGLQRIALSALAERWTGEYWYYWRVPDGWSGTVGSGDRGSSVRVLAELFARLDGEDRLLAREQFTAALAERVRLFQRRENLAADGVAGEQTLRALVLAAGSDLDRAAARRLLTSGIES